MPSSNQTITPLRKLSDGTQRGYIRAVKRLSEYLGRSPDTASIQDLRRFSCIWSTKVFPPLR